MQKPREPAVRKPAASRSLKTKHSKSGTKLGLKPWLRKQADDVTVIQLQDWLHNKGANFSKPCLGIGRTRTRVKKGGGNKGTEKNLSGK
jgi:hypothetical protein